MSEPGLILHRAVIRPEWVDYNGHMSEAYYVLVFGDATDAFYDRVGLNDAFRRTENVSAYTVEAHIRYLSEGHEGDALRIETRVLGYDAKRLRLHHRMVRESDRDVLSMTEISALHIDKESLRPTPFHDAVYARIEEVARHQADLPAPVSAISRQWAAVSSQA